MNNGIRHTLLVLFSLAMVANAGCTSMQTVHASEEAILEKKVRAGDEVTLEYANGAVETIKVTDIGATEITGIADDGRTIVADYETLIALQHKKVEALKTAGATVGVIVLGTVILAGAASVLRRPLRAEVNRGRYGRKRGSVIEISVTGPYFATCSRIFSASPIIANTRLSGCG